MTVVRHAVCDEVLRRLVALEDAAETKLMPSGDPLAFPARHIFDGGQAVVEGEVASTRYALDLTVEGYLEQAGGADAYAALNDLYAATVRALLEDETLGGLVETIDEGGLRVFVAPLASKSRLGFAGDFTITFATRRDDPAQPA
jgi:hypothetical protein